MTKKEKWFWIRELGEKSMVRKKTENDVRTVLGRAGKVIAISETHPKEEKYHQNAFKFARWVSELEIFEDYERP